MTDIYAMRRANGDWFAIEDDGKLHVPVFHSGHDALMARLRSVEMMLFSPVALDDRLLQDMVAGRKVDFCIINNPFAGLKRGSPLQQAELVKLMNSPAPPRRWKWLSRSWS